MAIDKTTSSPPSRDADQVRKEIHSYDGNTTYRGTWRALLAAGVVPLNLTEPPQARRGGFRWRDGAGRCYSLAGYGANGEFTVTAYLTPAERRDREAAQIDGKRREELAKRRMKLELDLRYLSQSEGDFRDDTRKTLNGCFAMLFGSMFSKDADGRPLQHRSAALAFSEAIREELEAHYYSIKELIAEAPLERDDKRIATARRARVALDDEGLQAFLSQVTTSGNSRSL